MVQTVSSTNAALVNFAMLEILFCLDRSVNLHHSMSWTSGSILQIKRTSPNRNPVSSSFFNSAIVRMKNCKSFIDFYSWKIIECRWIWRFSIHTKTASGSINLGSSQEVFLGLRLPPRFGIPISPAIPTGIQRLFTVHESPQLLLRNSIQ